MNHDVFYAANNNATTATIPTSMRNSAHTHAHITNKNAHKVADFLPASTQKPNVGSHAVVYVLFANAIFCVFVAFK